MAEGPVIEWHCSAIKDTECLEHDGRSLEIYCDKCREVVCFRGAHLYHRDHNSKFIDEVFQQHKQEIHEYLQPVKEQVKQVTDALHNLEHLHQHVVTHGDSVKNEIDALIDQLIKNIQQSGAKLKQNVDTLVQHKLTNISRQKEEGDIYLAQLKSCEQNVQDTLSNGSQQEILRKKYEMIKTSKSVIQDLTQQLELKEKPDIMFRHSRDIKEECSRIGEVSVNVATSSSKEADSLYPEIPNVGGNEVSVDSVTTNAATLKRSVVHASTAEAMHTYHSSQCKIPLNPIAIVGMPRSIDIVVPNYNWRKRNSLQCHLVHADTEMTAQCEIKHVENKAFNVSFTATCQGSHFMRVKAQKECSILCDPSNIEVLPSIKGLHHPISVASTTSGLLVVAMDTSIAIVDKQGHVIKTANTRGGGNNTGVCTTPDTCILVVSEIAPYITKYTMECTLVFTAKTSNGNGPLQFKKPQDIAVSDSGHVYVCDTGNNRIQVLNPDLTFLREFGERGSGIGQFYTPCGIAIDSQDSIYVCDSGNNRIHKFSKAGTCLYKVPSSPQHVAVDCDLLYFTAQDAALYATIGEDIVRKCNLPDSFWCYKGIAVDENNFYLCNYRNDQIIIF